MIIGDEELLQNITLNTARTGLTVSANIGKILSIKAFKAGWAKIKNLADPTTHETRGELPDLAALHASSNDPIITKHITPETMEHLRHDLNTYGVKFALTAPAQDGNCYLHFFAKDASTLEYAMKQVEASYPHLTTPDQKHTTEKQTQQTGTASMRTTPATAHMNPPSPGAPASESSTNPAEQPKKTVLKGKSGIGAYVTEQAQKRTKKAATKNKPHRSHKQRRPTR